MNQRIAAVSHHRDAAHLNQFLSANQFQADLGARRPRKIAEVELRANSPELLLSIDRASDPTPQQNAESGWDFLANLIGTVEGPADWATEHDHYLYGSPRRHER